MSSTHASVSFFTTTENEATPRVPQRPGGDVWPPWSRSRRRSTRGLQQLSRAWPRKGRRDADG
eukprot:7377484-Lingulodinium_polyedra.AAC.1